MLAEKILIQKLFLEKMILLIGDICFLFCLPWKGENVANGCKIGYGWIQNVKYFSFVFVARFFSN